MNSFRLLGGYPLIVGRTEISRTVLRPNIRALAIERRRIVQLEECVQQQFLFDDGGVVGDFDGFGMTRCSGADVMLRRVQSRAVDRTDAGVADAGQFAEVGFDASQAPGGEGGNSLVFHHR